MVKRGRSIAASALATIFALASTPLAGTQDEPPPRSPAPTAEKLTPRAAEIRPHRLIPAIGGPDLVHPFSTPALPPWLAVHLDTPQGVPPAIQGVPLPGPVGAGDIAPPTPAIESLPALDLPRRGFLPEPERPALRLPEQPWGHPSDYYQI